LIIAAGAGMGVDSGLPDFRGKDGFWKAYPALGREGVDFYSIANPASFFEQPALAWGFYGHRLNLYRTTVPHPGFEILKRWGEAMPLGYRVFTSNVDGQFQMAGFDECVVHECHGSIHHLQCLSDCASGVWSARDFEPQVDEENCLLLSAPPHCPTCGQMARPNVLMFGDPYWEPLRSEAQRQGEEKWLRTIDDGQKTVVIEIGAGTTIPSVRHFSQRITYEFGGRLIRINPVECAVPSSLDVGIATGCAQALAEIDQVLLSNG
jgi:NAD-dependent SIR2 family protein deacetylase